MSIRRALLLTPFFVAGVTATTVVRLSQAGLEFEAALVAFAAGIFCGLCVGLAISSANEPTAANAAPNPEAT